MKIALFLGAGASVPYGMPTTKKLRDKIDARNMDFPRQDLLDSSEFPDIEHILSVLDQLISFVQSRAGKLYAKHGEGKPVVDDYVTPGRVRSGRGNRERSENEAGEDKFKSYVARSRESKEIIERLITQNYRWDPSHDESAEKILRPLFDLARSKEGHVTVFTTNYDTVIEEYCANPDRRIELIDGFQFNTAMRAVVWDGKFVPDASNSRTRVLLYKIHGSMNWLAGRSASHHLILQKPDTGASDDRARDMYIRPSLDTKDEATQKEPYATILREFNHLLPSFDACVVIGYSFRDPHISKRLVEFAKAGKALVVLSPTAAADFKNNALNDEPELREKVGWGSDMPHKMTLESDGKQWHVHVINRHLVERGIDGVIEGIRSAIGDGYSARQADMDAEVGS